MIAARGTTRSPRTKTDGRPRRDPSKEEVIRGLSRTLEQAGYHVRREELKRGLGWRVASGTCRAFDRKLVFVDRRLAQDEQISFLRSKVMEVGSRAGQVPPRPAADQAAPGSRTPARSDAGKRDAEPFAGRTEAEPGARE